MVPLVTDVHVGNKDDSTALGVEAMWGGRGGKAHSTRSIRPMEWDRIKFLLPAAVFLLLE